MKDNMVAEWIGRSAFSAVVAICISVPKGESYNHI